MDTTSQFLRTFQSQIFDSFDEFQCKLKEFEQLTRSIYIIKSSKKLEKANCDREKLVYSIAEYACFHFDVFECASMNSPLQKNPRNVCSSRLSLSAKSGRLCIKKYNMVHNHLPLPDTIEINAKIRNLELADSESNDSIISDEVKLVLDSLVEKLPLSDISRENKMDTPNLDLRSCERKAAARDRLAIRAKRDRGIKLAPCLRRLAELASSVPEKRFHIHLNELEILTGIWGKGGFSCLLSPKTESPELIGNGDLHSTKVNDDLSNTANFLSQGPAITTSRSRRRSSKDLPSTVSLVSPVLSTVDLNNKPSAPYPYNTRRKGVRSTISTQNNGPKKSGLSNLVSKSNSIIGRTKSSPITVVKNLPFLPHNFPVNELLVTDRPNGQSQLPNGSNVFTTDQSVKNLNQSILGYILQPVHASCPVSPKVSTTQPLITIAPKGSLPIVAQPVQAIPAPIMQPFISQPQMLVQPVQTLQPFQPLSSSQFMLPFQPLTAPNIVQPHIPGYKPMDPKPRLQQMQPKVQLTDSHRPALVKSSFLDKSSTSGVAKLPWTPVIIDGDSCPYFLYVEDATFCYSAIEDGWLPLDQKTESVKN